MKLKVCRHFYDTIRKSLLLQYRSELEIEGLDYGSTDKKMGHLTAYRQFWEAGEGEFTETFTSQREMDSLPWVLSSTVFAYALSDNQVRLRQIPSRIFGVLARQWDLPPFAFGISGIAIDQSQELLVVLELSTGYARLLLTSTAY